MVHLPMINEKIKLVYNKVKMNILENMSQDTKKHLRCQQIIFHIIMQLYNYPKKQDE